MPNWSSGYVVDTPYTFGHYHELSPSWLELCLLVGGWETVLDQKRARNEPIRYLEIAIGHGLSLNINAATNTGEFMGNDFNPDHAFWAQKYANASKANIRICSDSIHELSEMKDLPHFDVIALHGVWSWISPQDMQDIIKIIYHKLNVGGVVYVSYNTNPGMASSAPLRHLIDIHARINEGSTNNSVARVKAGIEFAKSIADAGAAYFQQSPQVVERLNAMMKKNASYLPHEYANANWHLLHFEQVYEQFSQAKLRYATSAKLSEMYDAMSLTPKAKEILAGATDTVMHETIRDYLHNTMFRKDIWVKGGVRINKQQRTDKLSKQRFALVLPPDNVPKSISHRSSEIALKREIYDPVVTSLASGNHAPKTPNDIVRDAPFLTIDQAAETVIALCGMKAVYPAHDTDTIKSTKATSKNLNHCIMDQSRINGHVRYLASPVLGGGIEVDRFDQLFLLAAGHGSKTAADMAKNAWEYPEASGERLVVAGKTLETHQEHLDFLIQKADDFMKNRLPIYQMLMLG